MDYWSSSKAIETSLGEMKLKPNFFTMPLAQLLVTAREVEIPHSVRDTSVDQVRWIRDEMRYILQGGLATTMQMSSLSGLLELIQGH